MNSVAIVTLSRYPDLFEGLYENLSLLVPEVTKILVRDGDLIPIPEKYWIVKYGDAPFQFARNVNAGWKASDPSDVLLCGDDVRIWTWNFLEILQTLAYQDHKVGVVCPDLAGQSPFVCGYFKREVIDRVGPMDEQFTGYGYEDNDWCRRMEDCGYFTLPTKQVRITHTGGTSFYRREREGAYRVQDTCDYNRQLFNAKWGIVE